MPDSADSGSRDSSLSLADEEPLGKRKTVPPVWDRPATPAAETSGGSGSLHLLVLSRSV